MLLTGIELQGGQANIEGTSATPIRSEIRTLFVYAFCMI